VEVRAQGSGLPLFFSRVAKYFSKSGQSFFLNNGKKWPKTRL